MKRSEIERLLPEVFQRTVYPRSPIVAILEVMEALHTPAEEVLDNLDAFFDPYRAPDHFVFFLARWVGLERFVGGDTREFTSNSRTFPGGVGRLRELIMAAAYLSKWRGTTRGLLHFLETATGVQGFEVDEVVPDENGQPRPFHILVRAPVESRPYEMLVLQIIELEKPAYVTYDLEFGR